MIGLTGYEEDKPDDPVTIVSGALLDQPALPEPVGQQRREDLQLFNFLQGVAAAGGVHPVEIEAGDDPPDRYLTLEEIRWAVELTELTIEDLRADLARLRRFGRQLQDDLEQADGYQHLRGRIVQLQMVPASGHEFPKQTEELERNLKNALKVDKGFFGERLDPTAGLPKKIDVETGNYGEIGPVFVLVQGHGATDRILVSASVQDEIYESSALTALTERIRQKDKPPNEILVITTGLPDQRGYLCPADAFVFEAILDAKVKGRLKVPEPETLRGVVLHSFPDGRSVEIYRRADTKPPWPAPVNQASASGS